MLEVRNYFAATPFQGSLCFHYAFGIYPLMQICFIMVFLYFLRYFSIINFNNAKNTYSGNVFSADRQKWWIRFLKTLASSWFTFILLFVSLGVILIVNTVILASTSFVCRFEILISLKVVHNVDLIIIYFLTLILLLGDVVLHLGLIFSKNSWMYLFGDPYYFRFQIFLFVPFMIYNMVTEISNVVLFSAYLKVMQNQLNLAIFFTITYAFVLILDVLFPLGLTIFHLIVRLTHRRKKAEALDRFVNDPECLKLLTEFCKREYSIENLLCYVQIQEFKAKKREPMEIYTLFFGGADSMYEVNVSRSACNDVLSKIQSETFDQTLFDTLQLTVMTNLSDTYSRFIFTGPYQKWEQTIRLEREMLGQ
jgi:hypothetical protein